jgi:hypothetical protein
MSGFVIVPSRDYAAELLRVAESFSASNEYQSLNAEERTCTGLVFSAFSQFFEASIGDQRVIDECTSAIEHFASMHDLEAHNLIVTEVFEGFRRPHISARVLRPLSQALYERWIGRVSQ